MANSFPLHIAVVYASQARQTHEVLLDMQAPCTVLKAVQDSGLLQRFPEIDNTHIMIGIWGRKTALDHVLRDQDRIEIYRPLRVDPKIARRERFVKQGARGAGLFVKKRAGSKAGY
jgi:putative ubiquitin-RnfH superfamily antitoxin RatB of RatAB toxin-antitoxin module